MKYICIHGHFYQPPRENPWLEAIEPQDEAAPYHDWNERINAECYAPNTASRILDDRDRIVDIINNYGRISFDFGPTLLSWLSEKAPEVYGAVLDADRESRERFQGHGSAMAQAYNHVILPLASREDKEIQVVWGIRDFELRFGRSPEGMWLPETAVDIETLEVVPRLRLSDPSELLLRVRWLAILSGRVRASLAATGGVHAVEDVVKAVMAGAHAVQLVSSLLTHGPERLAVLRQGLATWMEEREYESIGQMRGSMSLARCPDPRAFERGNYMRILQTWRGGEWHHRPDIQ